MALFALWMQQARDTESPPVEANAMALATVDEQGRPHCRVLLLKGFDAQGFFVFFGNYDSAKGQNLAANPWAAMTFFSGRVWSGKSASKGRSTNSIRRYRMPISNPVPSPVAWVPGPRHKADHWRTGLRSSPC
nr:hypothetical protein GCM10020185_71440 [Pseudomonas brassicacearum subsp. brassicacearum]